jgi:hypothetical protein
VISFVRRPSLARTAARVATLGFAVAILLQLFLAAGILPITMAWGGSQSVLTSVLQLASVAAALVFVGCAHVIRRRVGLDGADRPRRIVKVLSWVITGFLFINTLGNLASQSSGERLVFAPLTFALALACLVVSMSAEAD